MSNSPDSGPWSYDAENLILRIFVQPRAAKNELTGIHEGELKLRITSPPVDGAANDACRQFFSKLLKVPKTAITVISGETSRHKRLKVKGGSAAGIERLLADRP